MSTFSFDDFTEVIILSMVFWFIVISTHLNMNSTKKFLFLVSNISLCKVPLVVVAGNGGWEVGST